MNASRSCPFCSFSHCVDSNCRPTYWDGTSKACTKGCQHNGHLLNHAACMHNNEKPFFKVSKVGSDKSIPMMESLLTSSTSLEIQYDSGCWLNLISKSILQLLPAYTYSLGNSAIINLLIFTGEGKLFPATTVKLYLSNRLMELVIVDIDLNSSSAYSFLTPHKWRASTGSDVTLHSGKVSILL